MKLLKSTIFLLIILCFCSCSSSKKSQTKGDTGVQLKLPETDKAETLFLVGDTGTDKYYNEGQSALFKQLKNQVEQAGKNSSVVFLGDNIYPAGLPIKKSKARAKAEELINVQLDVLKDNAGEAYFIPGNHDWNNMKAGGLKAVQRQEKYIQDYYKKNKIHFYPNDGCGDPVVKKIANNLQYIFIDTQWWLQKWDGEDDINNGCEVKSREAFLEILQNIFYEYKNEQLVVLMHHPLFSDGEHGGNFSPKDHLFPLRILNPNLWIPLPVIGSIPSLYRKLGGVSQDIPHPNYLKLKDGILGMLKENRHVIFASGHDHTLQYFVEKQHHFVVSGAASKINYVKQNGEAKLAHSGLGYSVLHFYKNAEVWLDFYAFEKDKTKGDLIYRKKIVQAREARLDN